MASPVGRHGEVVDHLSAAVSAPVRRAPGRPRVELRAAPPAGPVVVRRSSLVAVALVAALFALVTHTWLLLPVLLFVVWKGFTWD